MGKRKERTNIIIYIIKKIKKTFFHFKKLHDINREECIQLHSSLFFIYNIIILFSKDFKNL